MNRHKGLKIRDPHIQSSPRHLHYSRRWLVTTALTSGLLGLLIKKSHNPITALFKTALASGFIGLGMLYYGWRETSKLDINHIYLNLKRDNSLNPELVIAQLSDFHLGTSASQTIIAEAIQQLIAIEPDLILLTGDFLDSIEHWPMIPYYLKKLKAPLGVYACLGNHDYWDNPELISTTLEENGIETLVNEHRIVGHGSNQFVLAGVADPWCGRPNLAHTLVNVPNDLPVILMAHCPDYFEEIDDSRVILQLSGHTHAGHIALPLLGPLVLPHYGRIYYRGVYTDSNRWLNVNRGLAGMPLRIGARPEISIIHLADL